VAQAAEARFGKAVPIFEFERLGAQAREHIAPLAPELLLVFAYGKIFGPKFLALFPRGGLNIHPSILPRHRGSSPIPQAILDRDEETGVSIQGLATEMDCGDIYALEKIPLQGREGALALSEACAAIGADLAVKVLDQIARGVAQPRPQEGPPTYCAKIAKEDGCIDWGRESYTIDAQVRAFEAWPQAFTFLDGQRLAILEAQPWSPPGDLDTSSPLEAPIILDALPAQACGTILGMDRKCGIIVKTGSGFLALRRLQLAGKKALSYKEFANGARNLIGKLLTPQGTPQGTYGA
jgi:methionyl-tRNA formyltransferase